MTLIQSQSHSQAKICQSNVFNAISSVWLYRSFTYSLAAEQGLGKFFDQIFQLFHLLAQHYYFV